ncbi:MAG TPA: hypothetical protein VEH62_06220 [Gemmatimonadales bacterium]|nr:hypothetical protein [Gemmatimonadales bacterium]
MTPDDCYDPRRAEQLVEMLRALAQRIMDLDREGGLLGESSALLRAMGDLRSELFRYEVRQTFDSPEVAEHRRIVDEAAHGWTPDAPTGGDEEDPWRKPDGR